MNFLLGGEIKLSETNCPNCHRGVMYKYEAYDLTTNDTIRKVQCTSCGYWLIVKGGSMDEFTSSNMFTLEFSLVSGESGKFCGTKEKTQKEIDKYKWRSINSNTYTEEQRHRQIADYIEILKYGYQFEFKDRAYEPYEITVDNGLWMKIRYGIW